MREPNPETLTEFEKSVQDLPADETRKQKTDFMAEVVENYGRDLVKYRKIMIAMGLASVLFLPLFFVSIPIYSMYLSKNRERKQKIRRALDRWQDDLGESYDLLYRRMRNF